MGCDIPEMIEFFQRNFVFGSDNKFVRQEGDTHCQHANQVTIKYRFSGINMYQPENPPTLLKDLLVDDFKLKQQKKKKKKKKKSKANEMSNDEQVRKKRKAEDKTQPPIAQLCIGADGHVNIIKVLNKLEQIERNPNSVNKKVKHEHKEKKYWPLQQVISALIQHHPDYTSQA